MEPKHVIDAIARLYGVAPERAVEALAGPDGALLLALLRAR